MNPRKANVGLSKNFVEIWARVKLVITVYIHVPFPLLSLKIAEVQGNKPRSYKPITGPFLSPDLVIPSVIHFKMIIFSSISITK